MKVELRGIIQFWQAGHKHTQIVVMPEGSRIRSVHELALDLPVSKAAITGALKMLHGSIDSDIVWPGHVIARDIDQEVPK